MAVFKARYSGVCDKCKQPVAPGQYVSWSRRSRGTIYHAECIGEKTPAEGPQDEGSPPPSSDPNAPAASIDWSRVERIAQDVAERVADEKDAAMLDKLIDVVEHRVASIAPTHVHVQVTSSDGTVKVETVEGAHYALADLISLIVDGEHVYLSGPPGSGKSTGAVLAAKALKRRYGYVSLNPQTPESRLLGFIDAGGVYRETEFFRCYKWCGVADCDCCTGGVFCIDELDNGHPALLNTLNGMLEVDADGVGRGAFPCGVVQRHPAFVCVATGNTNGRGADKLFPERRALDAAFLERFAFLAWGYDTALEQAITLSINPNAVAWLAWVRKVRAFVTEHGIRLWASPRAAFKGAKRLKVGWSPAKIADVVLFKGLDVDTQARILHACPLPADAPSTPALSDDGEE